MFPPNRLLFLTISLFIFQESFTQGDSYKDSVNNWYRQRIIDLKAPDGWVNLTGLFWLEKGSSTLGSGKENTILVQHRDMPRQAGKFYVTEREITWITQQGSRVYLNNMPVDSVLVFSYTQKNTPQLAIGSLRFNIIQRADKLGIRLRDLRSPALNTFKAPDRFPVNRNWKIKASFVASPSASIAIENVLGQVNRESSPGQLVFTYGSKIYRLDVLTEGNQWFVLFADATSGKNTYPTGRFLYVPISTGNDPVYIDFNLAFNPPCAFTTFATCPIPPPQNRLPFAVTAGEKYRAHVAPR